MKRAWIMLLALALLLSGVALGEEDAASAAEEAHQAALELLETAIAQEDTQECMKLILEAAALAPDDVDILLNCSQVLFYLDMEEIYAEECEEMLRHALTLAEGKELEAVLEALAEQLIYAGRVDEAEALLLEAVEESPRSRELKLTLATVYYYADKGEESLAVLDGVIEEAPRNLEARRLRAAVLVDESRWEEALDAYRQIEKDWPDYLDGLYGMYLTYVASGEFEQGARCIDMLLAQGAEEGLWLERARIRLARQRLPEKALSESDALLRKYPENLDVAQVKLGALIMLERYEEAHEVAASIEPVNLDRSEIMHTIVNINEARWLEAEERVLTLLDREPAPVSWRYLSLVRLEGFDDVDGATQALAEAFAITGVGGADMETYLQLGHTYRRQGHLEQAARAYAVADALTWEEAVPLYHIVLCCLEAGRAEDAMEAVELMEERYPHWYETMTARLVLEDSLGHVDKALEAFQALGERFPYMAEEMAPLEAMLLAQAGDNQGMRILKGILDDKGEEATPEDWNAYAYALIEDGDYKAAQEALAQARAKMPRKDDNNIGLLRTYEIALLTSRGEMLWRQGDLKGSAKAYQEAAEMGWPARCLLANPKYDDLTGAQAYQAALDAVPDTPPVWDLTLMPRIPEIDGGAS